MTTATEKDALRILLIEDNPFDAELAQAELRRAGVAATYHITSNEAELRMVLDWFEPDLVLCDFYLPGFDGMTAMRIVRERYERTPLIFVTGTISEERAVVALQGGAVDFVLKSSLLRLPSAVLRAVTENRHRNQLEESLRESELRARQHAKRLEALWKVVNKPSLAASELWLEMLRHASIAIRPGQTFRGLLARVHGDDLMVEAIVDGPGRQDLPNMVQSELGQLRPVNATIYAELLAGGGGTQVWDDIDSGLVPAVSGGDACCTLIATTFTAGGSTFVLSFASTEVVKIAFGEQDTAYVELLSSIFANRAQVEALENSLREQQERTRWHAKRLERLWEIVNEPNLVDRDLWLAVLAQGAATMRPGENFRGVLGRIENGEIVVEAVAQTPDATALPLHRTRIGSIIPGNDRLYERLTTAGSGSTSWDDVGADVAKSRDGDRAVIMNTFTAGGATYILWFGSADVMQFDAQDRAFIDVIGSFFANHLQQRWQSDRIQYQQSFDILTGLLNRSQFRARARTLAGDTARYAMILLDVNAFREINESYGSMTGDALLVEVANALNGRILEGEIIGRIGGNAFGVYVPNPNSEEFVLRRARSLAAVFAQGFSTGGRSGKKFIGLTASLGIAMAPAHGPNIEVIMSHADAALSIAKLRGHGSTVLYAKGMEGQAQQRATLRNEIIEAVASNQFTLHYQPHVDIELGRVTGCEALIRWQHPERGLLAPAAFVPFAEQTGIITSIDDWVMRTACAAAKELGDMVPGFRLYFNLSGRQAGDPAVVRAFIAAARQGVPLRNLGVEITETDAMRDVEATRRVCRALRRLGVRVAIDDFGTGYSSLSSLKRLKVDVLKIDRTFVSGIINDPDDQTITKTIISIADQFGFESLAEGVEQPDEIAWLRDNGCRMLQGYTICRPIPMADFKAWLIAHGGRENETPQAVTAGSP